jgi:hypothetical protein
MKSRDAGGAVASLHVRAAEKRPLGVRLTVTASAETIRAPVKNRVDNTLIRTTVANRRRRRTDALAVVLLSNAYRGAHKSRRHSPTAVAQSPSALTSRIGRRSPAGCPAPTFHRRNELAV